MTNIRFSHADFEVAVQKVTTAAGNTLSAKDIEEFVDYVEAYVFVLPTKDDLVEAFKYAAARSRSLTGDVDTMASEFPVELTRAHNARAREAKNKEDQAKLAAETASAKQEASAKLSDIASTVNGRLEDVSAIINDLKTRVPAINTAAATIEIDIDDELNRQIEAIETAARGLLQCQTDVNKTSALKTAQAAEKKSLQHLADANAAKIAIDGIETRVNGRVEATKAAKEKEKQSTKKAKKNQVSKTEQFLGSPMGHVVVSAALIVALFLTWLFTPWYVFGFALFFALVAGVIYAASVAKGRARRGQNVAIGYTGGLIVIALFFLLLPLVGTGPGSNRNPLSGLNAETPTPTVPVDCWLAENAGKPECPLATTPES